MLADEIEAYGRALTAQEVARLLKLHTHSVYRLAINGTLPHFRIGSSVRFDCRALARFLREQSA